MNFLFRKVGTFIVLVGFLTISGNLYAQKEPQLPRVNAKRQAEYGAILKKGIDAELQYAYKLAAKKGWKTTQTFRDGRVRQLVRIDVFGIPIYEEPDNNTTAAATTNANKLYAGGGLGLDLSGSTMPAGSIAVFESGGSPLVTHQEFGSRINLQTTSATSSHATHVSGTIMAAGVNPIARGMAYALPELLAFSPSTTTMNNYSGQMLLSNHSYGVVGGWNRDDDGLWTFYGRYGDNEDYKFGWYDSSAQQWDNICFNAPYYLPVKSAGNFRSRVGPAVGENYRGYNTNGLLANLGPRPPGISSNNGYDIITTYGNAKNILTVGAVNGLPNGSKGPTDISISSFSSWGPTDDGRIKPDLVADGVSVISADHASNRSYTSMSGTSMAAPNATGTLTLLQELYNQKYGFFMRSATLKALVLATTSEAGTTLGPDYIYGWGLLNAEKAAKAILNNGTLSLIGEKSLSPNETETIQVVASGQGPLVATICWTDPAAVPVAALQALNNPTLRLVNDLDMRADDGVQTFYPWILDPANPSVAAVKGDNFRDNVEQVYIENPVAGKTYSFTIGHKNGLKDNLPQAFSVVITGAGGTVYCASNSGAAMGARIANLKLANVDYYPAQLCDSYGDFTSTIVEVQEGQSYPINITTSACGTSATAIAKIFVDWNNDGDFEDADELLATSPVIAVNGIYNTTVAIPVNLTANATSRMRVVMVETNNTTNIDACGTYTNGTTHDYSIKFLKQTRLYVKKDAVGIADGSSWANAIPELSDALVYASNHSNIEEIWVAKGTYKPSVKAGNGTEDRDVAFAIPHGLSLYGHFSGNEAAISERQLENPANETILSGDLLGNDIADPLNVGYAASKVDNAYHVVVVAWTTLTSTSYFDGFTIRDGYADGTTGNMTLNELEFARNYAGGITVRGTASYLLAYKNLKITNNIASGGGAGGVYINGSSNNTYMFNRVAFQNNKSQLGGGALRIRQAGGSFDAELNNCIFEGNESASRGGAIYWIHGNASARLNINNARFIKNKSGEYGGAIGTDSYNSGIVINNSIFNENEAVAAGAIYFTAETTPATDNAINNTVFYKNKAGNGGSVTFAGAWGTIINSTFYGNISTAAGGAIRLTNNNSKANVYNSIILGNTSVTANTADVSRAGGTVAVVNSITQGATGTGITNTNVVSPIPIILDVFANVTDINHTSFLRLKPVSGNPAIDAGDSNLVPEDITADLAGADRFNGVVDLGAYENHIVLPIKLADFSAKANNSSVIVSWITETETNNKHFILERSTDGVNFTTIATPESKGNGSKYSHTDFSPAKGTNYYRLIQVDNDGTKVTFDPVPVNFSLKDRNIVSVYPNPVVGGRVILSFDMEKYTFLQLVALNGQKLQSLAIANNETEKTIDISAYPSGTYFVLLTSGMERIVKKIVKP